MGVQFAKYGMLTSVVFGSPTARELKIATTGLLVYDTETRNESKKTAYRKVRSLCSICERAGIEIVYKKIDSTLRGNLGAELEALLNIFRHRSVIVCPTYPEYQRTIVNGHLLIRGVPVDKTKFANDPVSPVRSSNVKALVSTQTTERVANIPLTIVRRGPRYIEKAIRQLRKRRVRIICADAENRADLKSIANASLRSHVIPCGSAGLAEEIAAGLQPVRQKIMVLSASTNEATLNELRRSGKYPRALLIKANAAVLAGRSRNIEIRRIRRLVEKAFDSRDVVLVCSALYKTDFDPKLVSQEPISRRFRDPITNGLATAVSPLALSGSVDAIMLTGGEMAAAFLKRIQARGLRLESEILAGIPIGIVMSGRAAGLRVVTKAGGFGFRGSMRQILDSLMSTEALK